MLNRITGGTPRVRTAPTPRGQAEDEILSKHKQKLKNALLEANSLEDVSAHIRDIRSSPRSPQTPAYVPGSIFLTESSPQESPKLQHTGIFYYDMCNPNVHEDSFEQVRVDRVLSSAAQFQEKMMKNLTALRPNTPTSLLRPGTPSSMLGRFQRTASFMSTSSHRSTAGPDPGI